MKLLIQLILILSIPLSPYAQGVVNNTGTSPEDSLTVNVASLDSLGNPTHADSFYVVIFKSGINQYLFADSGTSAMTGLDTVLLGGDVYYYYHRAVADVDGAGAVGLYSGLISARNTAINLTTISPFTFQITALELDDQLLAIAQILDSMQSIDNWASKFNPAVDGVQLVDNAITAAKIASNSIGLAEIDNGAIGASELGSDAVNEIVDAVWDELQNGHTIVGAFGAYLDAPVSGVAGGEGAYAVEITAYDSAAMQPVMGANIAIRNLNQSALIAAGSTDSYGRRHFNLDADSFLVLAGAPGYLFSSFDTIVVSQSFEDTLYGYQFDPGEPSTGGLCRVYGYVYNLNGLPEVDVTVSASLPEGVSIHNQIIIAPYSQAVVTGADGYFYLDVFPSASLTPTGQFYEFTLHRKSGAILRKRLAVPDAPAWRLVW